jgi:ornithine cyclodeaminase/alanine dehydrogenase-like protein (mu-crystallin family)
MTHPPLRLRHSDMVRALDAIDLLDVVARELAGMATGDVARRRFRRLVPTDGAGELTAVEDLDTGRVCLLPAPSLRMISLAGLTGLSARLLLSARAVTAAVYGSGAVAGLHLEVMARHLPNVSHVTLAPVGAGAAAPLENGVRDRLARAGIALSVSDEPRRAAVGVNLVVVAETGGYRTDLGRPRPGMLVINAAGRDLPAEFMAGVDRLYVDDLGLLEHNQQRGFVRSHLAGVGEPANQQRQGWHHRARWREQRQIESDLGLLLTRGRRRTDIDDVVLVELLGGGPLDGWLAGHLYEAAIMLGLGRQ